MIAINLSKPKIKLRWARLWDNKIHLVFLKRHYDASYRPSWRSKIAVVINDEAKKEK